MAKVLVVGASGLLGSSLVKYLKLQGNTVVTITNSSLSGDYVLDASDRSVINVYRKVSPDVIVNLAAITSVDLCERNVGLAFKVNSLLAENIGIYSEESGVYVIHISTDHLYESGGLSGSAEEEIEIINNYAMTKYCGERSLNAKNSIILRTNFFGKSYSVNSSGFCDSFLDKAKKNESLTLFDDVYFSPVSMDTVVRVVGRCVTEKKVGVYNLGSRDGLSKADFLLEFLSAVRIVVSDYRRVSVDDVSMSTRRPKDMRMNVRKFERVFQIQLPSLSEEIQKVAKSYVN